MKVAKSSKFLKTGKCSKLSPTYCGSFTILKRIGEVAYKLALPEGCRIHSVFHVERNKKVLCTDDNLVGEDILVELIESPSLPHEPERILDVRERRTRHTVYMEYLAKWKDRSEESSTQEKVSNLQKRFLNVVFEKVNFS